MTERDQPQHEADLKGRIALITGAGSGIGRAMALTFAQSGAKILVNDIIADRAHETVAMVSGAGGEAVAHVADVSDETAVAAMVADAVERWGRIDILCNNAGVMDGLELVEDVSTDLWNHVFGTNVTGAFFVLRAVLPHMRKQGKGAIINTASAAALRGGCAGVTYVASKHAVAGLTRSIAWSHAKDGIRCNAICPGAIHTNIMEGRGLEDLHQEGLDRAMPIMALAGKGSGPEAIANVALFLASDAAFFVNGVIMPVDGGWMAG